MTTAFTDSAKVMSKGQVTIPKDVRQILGVNTGDRVTFIVEGNSVRIINSALYAMEILQSQMAGEAARVGINSEEDVVNLLKDLRAEREAE